MHFIVVRQSGKRSGFFIYHLKYSAFTKVKRVQSCKNWSVKGVPLVIIRYMKGGPFLSKMVGKKRKGLHLGAEPSRIKLY